MQHDQHLWQNKLCAKSIQKVCSKLGHWCLPITNYSHATNKQQNNNQTGEPSARTLSGQSDKTWNMFMGSHHFWVTLFLGHVIFGSHYWLVFLKIIAFFSPIKNLVLHFVHQTIWSRFMQYLENLIQTSVWDKICFVIYCVFGKSTWTIPEYDSTRPTKSNMFSNKYFNIQEPSIWIN